MSHIFKVKGIWHMNGVGPKGLGTPTHLIPDPSDTKPKTHVEE